MNARPSLLPLYLVVAAALCWSDPARALPVFTATPQGDWFDGTSWSGGIAPSAADDAIIDNGATAVASSASPLYPGGGTPVAVNDLVVGSKLAPVDAAGAVELVDVDLDVSGDLSIGVHGAGLGVGSASGSLTSTSGDHASGNLRVTGNTVVGSLTSYEDSTGVASGSLGVSGDLETANLFVGQGVGIGEGVVAGDVRLIPTDPIVPSATAAVGSAGFFPFFPLFGGTPDATATGSLSVAGNLEYSDANKNSRLYVGRAEAAARADGFLEVAGDVLGFQFVDVGVADKAISSDDDDETVAKGELHIAGKLGEALRPRAAPFLSVGVTRANAGSGPSSAEGFATIGEIVDSRVVDVGVAEAGPATGVLEVGGGGPFSANVGQTSGNSDAHGTLTTAGDLFGAQVGVSEGGGGLDFNCMCITPFATGDAVGSVVAAGFATSALVGYVASDGSAVGTLEVEGIARGSSAPGFLGVGLSDRGAGTAKGNLLVRSGGIDASVIAVGMMQGAFPFPPTPRPPPNGTVTGVLESTGLVVSQSSQGGDKVGYANQYSQGHANGTWILHDGSYSGRTLIVGVNEGTGSATGRVHLDHMFVDLGTLTLGDGATLEIDIAGVLRGNEYSAIDADVAQLDGDLALAFTGPAQNGIYDLIISAALNGITGDFDSVSIAGLAAGQSASWGVEPVGSGSNPVEVFRLYVVPEPATGALVALGLLGLAGVRHRRRAW